MSCIDKPKMTSAQLVAKMRDEKNIAFDIMDERSAELYLREHNNYFRTVAYRKNFSKYVVSYMLSGPM